MRKRIWMYAMAVVCMLLAGCMGAPRTETIVIDDAEQAVAEEETSSFAVDTIYTVLDEDKEVFIPVGWIDDNSLLGLTPSYPYDIYFERVHEPFTAKQKMYDLNPFDGEGMYNSIVLSPDRSRVSYVDMTDGAMELILHSLSDGVNTRMDISRSKSIYYTQMSWSNNNRFFSYADSDDEDRGVQLFVFDTVEEELRQYQLPSLQKNEWISFVSVSDNGKDAVMVKTTGRDSMLEWGELEGDAFVTQYRHPISPQGVVEWIHPDQIVFGGADGTVYAYDRRNRLLSVLLNDVERFRLSSDRKHIAYTQGDAIYAASIYGNTVLNRQSIYKGLTAYGMEWSPNNGKLLVYGLKSSVQLQSREPISVPGMSQTLVIAFK